MDWLHPVLSRANLRWLDDTQDGHGLLVAGGYANSLLYPDLHVRGLDVDLFYVDDNRHGKSLRDIAERAIVEQRHALTSIVEAFTDLHGAAAGPIYVNTASVAYQFKVTTLTFTRCGCFLTLEFPGSAFVWFR